MEQIPEEAENKEDEAREHAPNETIVEGETNFANRPKFQHLKIPKIF